MANELWLMEGLLEDWFVLEGGKNWASIEGTGEEWLVVAGAMESPGDPVKVVNYKRLAAKLSEDGGEWRMYSPRNAVGDNDTVTIGGKDARKLAAQIRECVGRYRERQAEGEREEVGDAQ